MNTSSSSESDLEVLEFISSISVPRNLRHRRNPFEMFTDEEFQLRYRFNKNTVIHLSDTISSALVPIMHRKYTLSVLEQIFIALRFYATGTFQIVIGDDINVHKTTVSRVVYKVSKEIAKRARSYISMPNVVDLREVKAQFFDIAGFPNVIGCVDGSHIPIQSPGAVLHNIALQQNDTLAIDSATEEDSTESIEQPLPCEGNHFRRLLVEQYFS
ncbi:unnamed protein product [Parnassius apollo]|uniref:(apollo) hypothetical protein n=1 Tax=Parnassius apollo TaxID=110799 RepID=A0A8S3X4T1_PARAO|nr:unnamed protein product [Parnassius apollo]